MNTRLVVLCAKAAVALGLTLTTVGGVGVAGAVTAVCAITGRLVANNKEILDFPFSPIANLLGV